METRGGGVGGGWGWDACKSEPHAQGVPPGTRRLRNEGAKPLTCCLRTGQAWAGEEDVELAPVSSRPIVGERGEDGSSG